MGLGTYKEKRSFDKTPEPEGRVNSSSGPLRFVIQKHDASHLHYDFRLEMEGVLKSWAVPKGPSVNPADKRLAMMVEDHPFEYRTFEGNIPSGNYGAGSVIIWDEGFFEPAVEKKMSRKEQEKYLLSQLHKGNLSIILKGKKLKGEFTLIHTRRDDQENAWILVKKNDRYAKEIDITTKDKSVVSGLTVEEVAKTSKNEWKSNRTAKTKPKPSKAAPASPEIVVKSLASKGKKKPFPEFYTPMLATLTDKPFDDKDWIFEVKWDGYRALAYCKKKSVSLLSRNRQEYTKKYYPIAKELENASLEAILDGEIVVLNEKGNSDFQLMQGWQKNEEGQLAFYVFDILWLSGYSLVDLPLKERKAILEQVLPQSAVIRYSDHVEAEGKQFFEVSRKAGLEGIMAKMAESVYQPSLRSKSWLKIKTDQRQEAVIAGFTEARGSRKHFGALVLGIYEGKEFHYIGHSGSGFNQESLNDVYKKLKALVIGKPPFKEKPKTNMPVTWVKPKLVCEVKFQEWTRDNLMRQPIFMGLREDKDPTSVQRERKTSVETILEEEEEIKAPAKKTTTKKAVKQKSGTRADSRNLLVPSDAKGDIEVKIGKQSLKFTNPDKVYWPKEKITKADMLNYYDRIGEYILPYMKDRPQSLNRHPDGINGKSFYQKNVSGKVAPWLKTYNYFSDSDQSEKKFLVCTDHASLLYIANLGCIELNPWHSRIQHAEQPDWCVIDLDPGEISFAKVIEAAQVVHKVLESLGIPSYCKTSGSTGLHIYIPLGAKYSYEQSRQLAELIVHFVHDELPRTTSIERNPAKRKTRIYLDFLQNREIQTIAAPYSLRPKPGATVSTPLDWSEVKAGLKVSDFHIGNILARLKDVGDLFEPVLGEGIDLGEVLKRASSI